MTENYIYAPEHNIEGGFRCKVPLPGSRQVFMIDGGVQGTGRPLDIRFERGKIYGEALQVISIRTEKHPEDISTSESFHFEEGSSARAPTHLQRIPSTPRAMSASPWRPGPLPTSSSCRTSTTGPRTTPGSTST